MTMSTITNRVAYAGDGVSTAFAVPFPFGASTDLEVWERTLATGAEVLKTLTTHYTVTGGAGLVGTVTATSPPSALVQWIILRATPQTQLTDFEEGDPFPAANMEDQLDKAMRAVQDVNERVDRAPTLSKATAITTPLVFPAPGAGQMVKWNAAGTALETGAVIPNPVTGLDVLSNYADFATMVTAVGASERTVIVDVAGTVAANVTVPATLHLWFLKTGVITVNSGVTLTFSGPFDAGPFQIFAGTGTVTISRESADFVRPEWWGAVAVNTKTAATVDASAAFASAWAASTGWLPIRLMPGYYLLTDTMTPDPLVSKRWCLEGARGEHGANQYAAVPDAYNETCIVFNPAVPGTFMCDFVPASGRGGPFIARNITFDNLAGAYGIFRVDMHTAAAPAFGFAVENCAYQGPDTRTSNAEEVTDGYVVDFNWPGTAGGAGFAVLDGVHEPVVRDFSGIGGDCIFYMRNVDSPRFVGHGRIQYCHVPIARFSANSGGALQNSTLMILDGWEFETWTFAPIVTDTTLTATGCRAEQNDHAYGGAYAMTETATVTAGDDDVVFSSTVAGKLFPLLSVIGITDAGGIVHYAIVKAVSADGLTVTTFSNATATTDVFGHTWTFSLAGAAVTRIHGSCGVFLHTDEIAAGSGAVANLVGWSLAGSTTAPAFVFQPRYAASAVTGAVQVSRTYGLPAVIVGNRLPSATFKYGVVSFMGCSDHIVPGAAHPLAVVVGEKNVYGGNALQRPRFGIAEDLALTRRHWEWSPKNGGTSTSYYHRVPFIEVPGETGTGETVWAWALDATYRYTQMEDVTLPSSAVAMYRVRVKTKAGSGTPSLVVKAIGIGTATTVATLVCHTYPEIHEFFMEAPANWYDATRVATTQTGFSVDGGTGSIYLAAISVEELRGDWQGKATAAPSTGTWDAGRVVWKTAPASGSEPGWVCTTAGTFGTATDATGDTDGSTAVITGMTDTSDFFVGQYVSVSAGFASTGPFRILALTATTMTLDTNSNAVAANVTVAHVAAVFKAMGNLA